MSDLSSTGWASIGYVTSGFSLLAFVVAGAVTAYKAKLSEKIRILKDMDSKDKIAAMDRILEYYSIDSANLTKEQKYNLIMEQVKISRHRLNVKMFCFCFASVIFAGIAYASIQNKNEQELQQEERKQEEKKRKMAEEKKLNDQQEAEREKSEKSAEEKKAELAENKKTAEAALVKMNGLNGMLKIPLGSTVDFVDANIPGEWELVQDSQPNGTVMISHDDGVYLSSQVMNNTTFKSRTGFSNGKARSIELSTSEEWVNKKYLLMNETVSIDTSNNKQKVDDLCFGKLYSKLNNEMISVFGKGEMSKVTTNKSKDMKYVTTACVANSGAVGACSKEHVQTSRVFDYKVDGYKLEFEAIKDDISRLENRGAFAELNMGRCSWMLKYSKNGT